MAHDVWLLRRTLITCLLLSVFTGNAKGANKTLSTVQIPLPNHAKDSTFPSSAQNSLITNSSLKVGREAKHRSKVRHKPVMVRMHVRQKSNSHGKQATKKPSVEGSEETGANRARMQVLDKYFVHPEILKEAADENGFTKRSFLSALSLNGLLGTTQNLDREASARLLDLSRKGFANDEPRVGDNEMERLHVFPETPNVEKYGENSIEGRKIVKAASLLESSLESQGTGLIESVKYKGEKIGNRARAFQYFLPTHSTMKLKERSRYRYVNSLIKPQLAGISADLNALEAQRSRAKSINLKALKNGFKSGESVSGSHVDEVQVAEHGTNKVAELKASKEEETKEGSMERNAGPQYHTNDMFVLGAPDHSTYLQDVFLANPYPIHHFSGSGNGKFVHSKHRAGTMVRPTSRWKKFTATDAASQSKISKVAFGKIRQSEFQESIHSGKASDSDASNADLNSKLNGSLLLISQPSKKLKATSPVLLQLFKDKAISHIEGESNDLYNQRKVDASVSGSSQAYRVRPSYFRPTKMRDVPKVTTLPSHKRTTIPVSSEYESWAPTSGEKSGSGEGVMAPLQDHLNHKPTHGVTTMGTLSTTRKTDAGVIGVTDKETKNKCEKMGKSDYREKCPQRWLSFDEFCYLFVPHSKGKWEEFPQKCNDENALLAMPKTDRELKFLQDKISSSKHRTKYFYIGLKKKSGVWTWIDDMPYTRDVRVKDKLGDKSCGALSKDGEIHLITCNEPKAGYVCELRTGVRALSILALGDSLTNGFHSDDKSHTPYARTLEYLLNKDVHRCYTLTTVAKDGTEASEMSAQLQSHLKNAKSKYSWVIILAGTNDIIHNSHTRTRRAWDTAVEHIIDLHITSHRFGAKTMVVTIPEMDCEESDRPPCLNTRLERKYINEKLRRYARTNDFTILCDLAAQFPRYSLSSEERKQMWEEGLHMKPAGYERMAEIIYKDLLAHINDERNL